MIKYSAFVRRKSDRVGDVDKVSFRKEVLGILKAFLFDLLSNGDFVVFIDLFFIKKIYEFRT